MNPSFTSLSNQYNALLNKYKNTFKKYINSISNQNNNKLQIFPNYHFSSNSIVETTSTLSAKDCLHQCSIHENCIASNYFANNQKCILNNGNGYIIPSSNKEESAIVFTSLKLSYDLKIMNQQLMNLNKKISDIIETQKDSQKLLKDNNKNLLYDYSILESEKEKIDQIILEEELLNSVNENSELIVTQKYYSFIVYLLVVLLIIFLFIKFFIFSNSGQRGGKRYFFTMK